jgi:para-aminobenzoate synthetase component 1
MLIEEIQYVDNGSRIFDAISNEPFSIFLDSNYYSNMRGQFDIITATPETILITFGNTTKIISQNNVAYSSKNSFELIKKFVSYQETPNIELPFTGGAIGFLGYDITYQLHKLPKYIPNDYIFPDMIIGIYNWAIVNDHMNKKTFLVQNKEDKEQYRKIVKLIKKAVDNKNLVKSIRFNPTISFSKYSSAFKKVKKHIEDGDCYQVNLSQRFDAYSSNSPWNIYKKISSKSQANYAAYFNTLYGQIICQSPEKFIKINNRKLETNPIKGTIKIANSDSAYKLLNSKKNRAENLMIVDLLRNDLHKSCNADSIVVDKFCELLQLQSLFHLESKITGYLNNRTHPIDAIKYAFPGGSITGAPKIRSMHISESVEHRRRSIFCGSLVYISNNGNINSNIMIRTLLAQNSKIYAWAGGGIVLDSDLHSEYDETINKLDNIFSIL